MVGGGLPAFSLAPCLVGVRIPRCLLQLPSLSASGIRVCFFSTGRVIQSHFSPDPPDSGFVIALKPGTCGHPFPSPASGGGSDLSGHWNLALWGTRRVGLSRQRMECIEGRRVGLDVGTGCVNKTLEAGEEVAPFVLKYSFGRGVLCHTQWQHCSGLAPGLYSGVSLLVVLMWCQRQNLDLLHARQVPYCQY